MASHSSVRARIKRLELLRVKIDKMLGLLKAEEALGSELETEVRELIGAVDLDSPKRNEPGTPVSRVPRVSVFEGLFRPPAPTAAPPKRSSKDLILNLFDLKKRPITQPEILEELAEMGYDFSRQAISYAMRSLEDEGVVEKSKSKDSRSRWKYSLVENDEEGGKTPGKGGDANG